MTDKAIKKLNDGLKGVTLSQKATVVKKEVVGALIHFCTQNSEFAQAIVQSDKTVVDCIEHTVKGAGSGISDFEAYSRAVAFWFPGATIHCSMTIDLGDGGFSNENEQELETEQETPKMARKGLQLSLDEMLGM